MKVRFLSQATLCVPKFQAVLVMTHANAYKTHYTEFPTLILSVTIGSFNRQWSHSVIYMTNSSSCFSFTCFCWTRA